MSCACTSRLARMSLLISKTCSSAIRSSAGGSSCAVSISESSSLPSSSSIIARRSASTPCRSASKSLIQPSRRVVCSCSRSHISLTSTSSISSRNSSAISSKIAWISSSFSVSSFLKPRPACPVRVSSVTSMAATFLPYAWIAASCFAFRVICISFIPEWSVLDLPSSSLPYAGSVCTSPIASSCSLSAGTFWRFCPGSSGTGGGRLPPPSLRLLIRSLVRDESRDISAVKGLPMPAPARFGSAAGSPSSNVRVAIRLAGRIVSVDMSSAIVEG